MEGNFLQLRSAEMAYYGRFRESQALGARQVELLIRQGLPQRAAAAISFQAISAAMLGQLAVAREQADAAMKFERSVEATANLAIAYASLGDATRARRLWAELKPNDIPDAQQRALFTQVFEALAAVKSGRAAEAVKRLQDLPVENKHLMVTNGLFTRAQALRRDRADGPTPNATSAPCCRGSRSSDTTSRGPFSHLGLARALAAQGNTAGAREEYKKFLDLWSQADADLAVLQKAKGKCEAGDLGLACASYGCENRHRFKRLQTASAVLQPPAAHPLRAASRCGHSDLSYPAIRAIRASPTSPPRRRVAVDCLVATL